MNTLIIPIHSFVDVITNSSSEIFVSADKSTVTAIKKLVDNIISAAAFGKDATNAELPAADDIFKFELVTLCTDSDYDDVYLTTEEIKQKKAEVKAILNDTTGKYTKNDKASAEDWDFGDSECSCSAVRVTVKDNSNKNAVAVANVLSDLSSLFSIESRYC